MAGVQPESGGSVTAGSPFDGGRLAEIAAGLADQFALLYEAKPVDPQVHMAGNMLNFAFQGAITTADESHLEAGHLDELRAFRERFLNVIADRLESVVALLTGSHVTFFSAAFDPATRTTNVLFVLDLLPDSQAEQRRAIRNWSEQVRRNARELRLGHLQTREAHIALRERVHEQVAARSEKLPGDDPASEDA